MLVSRFGDAGRLAPPNGVEHYEIAGFGTARSLGENEIAETSAAASPLMILGSYCGPMQPSIRRPANT